MADNRVVDIFKLESDLTSIGNAIRGKTGSTGLLTFPSEMVSAINGITTGGGGLAYATGTYTPASDVNKFTINYSLPKPPQFAYIWTTDPNTLPLSTVGTHLYASWCLYIFNTYAADADPNKGYGRLLGLALTNQNTWLAGAGALDIKKHPPTSKSWTAPAVGQNVYRYLEAKRKYYWIVICED